MAADRKNFVIDGEAVVVIKSIKQQTSLDSDEAVVSAALSVLNAMLKDKASGLQIRIGEADTSEETRTG